MIDNIYKTRSLNKILLLVTSILIIGCARVVAPQGGPEDKDPPEIVESRPLNYSTNYDGSDIRIFFNEYINLHNLQQQMLVSPPLSKTPEVRLRRRSLIMSVEEKLMDSTTYSFFFGDAIRDLTEGNAIHNFRFVVSTGDYVDSLSVRGEVMQAYDLKPAKDIYVMMYNNIYDSVPYKELPIYITRTGEDGKFEITNMRKGKYIMFALEDMNFNYMFDLPNEKIAFIDSLVKPEYITLPQAPLSNDTLNDTIPDLSEIYINNNDTLPLSEKESSEEIDNAILADDMTDRLIPAESIEYNYFRMYLFQERDTIQRIARTNYAEPGIITMEFRIPFDSVYLKEYRNPFERDWKVKEFSKKKDSLYVWLDNVERDSLFLEVWDRNQILDSVSISLTPREVRRRVVVEPALILKPGNSGSQSFAFFKEFEITANHPIIIADIDKIIVLKNDSIPVEAGWSFYDHANKRLRLDKTLEEDTKYSFMIPDSTFTDIFNLTNSDTIKTFFTTTTESDYGVIILNLTLPKEDENYILQLLNNKEDILREKLITNSDIYRFRHLNPSAYAFKIIHDKNHNGKWDTGNYLKRIQPEPVYILEEQVTVRRNWDHEIFWSISP